MEIDPIELVKTNEPNTEAQNASMQEKRKNNLNTAVAITVALLATFMGICKVKDDNIVQAMQQAQASRIDDWALYQARNLRAELAQSTSVQLKLQAQSQPVQNRPAYNEQVKAYESLAARENQKKLQQKRVAETDQRTYDSLNFRDDQFDLSDAALSIAIALLAITSLTQKRWLFFIAMIPTTFGFVMGLSGLLGWRVHPDFLIQPLTQNPRLDIQSQISGLPTG